MAATGVPFEILHVLGEGAFGSVCVARLADDPLRRLVAIKILKREYAANEKVLYRARDEARLLSRLDHPHIVRVEQLMEVQGRPVIVMELVQGVSLKDTLVTYPKGLPGSVAMEVIRQTALALHVAHHEATDEGGRPLHAIHRDIKPSNMLLSIHGQLKVVDFGIATGQFSERESHTESLVMGSRPYMAPERMDGAPDTPAVDVFSLGMSLYELLTGRTIPLSVNPTAFAKELTKYLDALEVDGLGVAETDDLRRLLRATLAYEPASRPQARAIVAELDRLVDAVDPAHHVTLPAFAADVVEPLYERATRRPLGEAMGELEDAALIRQAVEGPRRRRAAPRAHVSKQAAAIVGALVGLLVGLSLLAVNKARDRGGERPVLVSDSARVKVWIPSDATARVGQVPLLLPGFADVDPGPQTLEVYYRDGRKLRCQFEAADGMGVRLVIDGGATGLSVDDGPARPCVSFTTEEDGAARPRAVRP